MPSQLSKRSAYTEQGRRLRETMELREMNIASLAREARVDYATVRQAVRGAREPRMATQYALCAALRVKTYWVITGTGDRDATAAEVEEYWQAARGSSAADLVPVTMSSLGIDIWLTETPDGRRTTTDEREWLRNFPWLDRQARYHDLLFGTALQLYRQMAASTDKAQERAQLT